ncbi:MAG: NnrS family protein [Psychrobium sp.]
MKKLQADGILVDKVEPLSVTQTGLAFRPFFLLGSLFGLVSLVIWGGLLNGLFSVSLFGGGYWWHIHEMLFGFVAAIIVGFLLTAVKTWTGQVGLSGVKLMLLVLLWLTARILLLIPTELPKMLISVIDILFLPVAALLLALPIIKVKLWRNLIFIPLLLVMSYTNAMTHCSIYINSPSHLVVGSTSMVLLVTFMMCLMGGRVFPMFTANGTKTERVAPISWLEKSSLILLFLVLMISLFQLSLPSELMAGLYISTSILHFYRLARWRIWVTLRTPLVWSLHVSYLFIPLGLILLGISEVSTVVTKSQGIHALTVGGMGLMILSMVARVSLGHTGRTIISNNWMTFAFVLVLLAGVIRVFGQALFGGSVNHLLLAIILWAMAYGIFLVRYFPILTSARVDGKAG